MKKITYICDRCGKEVEHPEELRAIYTHPNYSEEDHAYEENIMNDMDFCPECLEAIKFFATRKIPEAALKAAEPAKPKGRPGRKPGRKKIDAERAWQMYMQGVKVLDIAKEFDAQPSSIHTLLSKMRKERLDENGKIKEEYREDDEDEGFDGVSETV
nr:MAG TPA: Putative toxin VapC6 domain, ZN ribbon domain [Caudoviricetes sp.]